MKGYGGFLFTMTVTVALALFLSIMHKYQDDLGEFDKPKATLEYVCFRKHVFVMSSTYYGMGITQLLVNGEHGLEAVSCNSNN